jgi:hypothetical protein
MGVTIHFEGKLKSELSYHHLIDASVIFAVKNKMPFEKIASDNKRLERVANETDWNYEGPVKGIKILPGEDCEPLWLEFDENLIIQDFCKTQFGGKEIHIKIIELFDALRQCFTELIIADEGEYWETRNAGLLQQLMDECFGLIEKAKSTDQTLSGPFRMPDGRIVDLMHR